MEKTIKAWAVIPELDDGTDMLEEMARYNLAHYPLFAGKEGANMYIQGQEGKYERRIVPCTITYQSP